jgi:predicted small metal-binding protein/mannose-6-phosphate isomerase-like protein (cupin superfamily)
MTTNVNKAQVFRYETPDLDRGKGIVWLARTDLLRAIVQVVREGGENNLHSHSGNDGFWMVLGGRARYYGEGDVLLAELGKYEGILIPRGFKYWFESASEEPLEVLHVAAFDQKVKDERTDYTPQASVVTSFTSFQAARPAGVGEGVVVPPTVYRELRCRDCGVDCDFTARAESIEGVIEQCAEHAKTAHGITSFPPNFWANMRQHIRSVRA